MAKLKINSIVWITYFMCLLSSCLFLFIMDCFVYQLATPILNHGKHFAT